MKKKMIVTLFFLTAVFCFGQNRMPGYTGYRSGNFNPDSLTPIEVSGRIIADSSITNGMFYIDTNNDHQFDYVLNFGPKWYKPDSSAAIRPSVGDSISVEGGLYKNMYGYAPMIVVYDIDNNFWRAPYDSYWNEMGRNSMMGGYRHMGMGYAFGWNHDSLSAISISGMILVDSTLSYNHYYLDTNNDGTPDYFLNFGPPWYNPKTSIKLPSSGDHVSISGEEMGTGYMNMILVFKLNDQVWRDSTQIGNNLGGGWVKSNLSQPQQFFNPFDENDRMVINPGWHSGGMMGGGGMMPDSLYCQLIEVFPHDVPDDSGQNIIAAFEAGIFYPDGMNTMEQSGSMGGSMNFNSAVNFQFHFDSLQSKGFYTDVNNLKIKYWDGKNNQWVNASGTVFSKAGNTLPISQNQVSNFYAITSNRITGIEKSKRLTPSNFSLEQNYPNPFNPSTNIEFSLKNNSEVQLTIYNVLGQKIKTLFNGRLNAGLHIVHFNAVTLPSGIYFYRLEAGPLNQVKKMELLK